MCIYDDMIALRLPATAAICCAANRNPASPKSTTPNCYLKTRKNKNKYLESVRALFLAYLLLSPVNSTPILRKKRSSNNGHIWPPKSTVNSPPWELWEDSGSNEIFSHKQENSRRLIHQSLTSTKPLKRFSVKKLTDNPITSPDSSRGVSSGVLDSFSNPTNSGVHVSSKSKPVLQSSSFQSPVKTNNSPSTTAHTPKRNLRIRHHSRRSLPHQSMDNPDTDASLRRQGASAVSPSTQGGAWINPCPNLDKSVDENATPKSLSTTILRAVHEAKSQVDKFINDFAQDTLLVSSWQEWLPDHEDFSMPFLNNSREVDLKSPSEVPFPTALQEAYELMQRRAVGIEQVTLDQALYQSKFLAEFRHIEDRIVHVLCELRHAMIQSGVVPTSEVTKDLMEERTRDVDDTHRRNIRDAVILREYIDGLRLMHGLFSHYASV